MLLHSNLTLSEHKVELTIVYHFFQITLGWEAGSEEQNRLLVFVFFLVK